MPETAIVILIGMFMETAVGVGLRRIAVGAAGWNAGDPDGVMVCGGASDTRLLCAWYMGSIITTPPSVATGAVLPMTIDSVWTDDVDEWVESAGVKSAELNPFMVGPNPAPVTPAMDTELGEPLTGGFAPIGATIKPSEGSETS